MFTLTSWTKLHNEQELQHRIAAGDVGAFEELYRATNRQMFTAVMTYAKETEAARDITQEVYIKLWEKRATLTGLHSLSNYLFIVARNAALDHLKKLASGKKALDTLTDRALREYANAPAGTAPHSASQNLDDRDTRDILRQAMERLSPQQRRAYYLAHEEELSHAEIADHMEISSFTVKRHLELARRFVRSYVSEHLTTILALLMIAHR